MFERYLSSLPLNKEKNLFPWSTSIYTVCINWSDLIAFDQRLSPHVWYKELSIM